MTLDLPVDLSGLVTLKQRLESFLKDYEEKVASARSQLHHVEALLEHYPTFTLSSSTPQLSVNPSASVPQDFSLSSSQISNDQAPSTRNEIVSVNGITPKAPAKKGRHRLEIVVTEPDRKRKPRQASPDMLPIFGGKTLTQAVLSVMEKYRGGCIDADGMVREVYGEVSEGDFAIVKDRITKNLSKGKIDGLWQRVPEQLGYYTIAVDDIDNSMVANLPRKTRGVKRISNQPSSKLTPINKGGRGRGKNTPLSSLKMRSPYQGSTIMEAIAKVMQEHKGEFVDADTVMRSLYGELPPETRRQAKDRITKGLSKGKIDGMWERVPERTGYYTLSMSAVMS